MSDSEPQNHDLQPMADFSAILARKSVGGKIRGLEGAPVLKQLVGQWLSGFDNERTIACATKEIERFAMWLKFEKLAVGDIDLERARQYINHLKAPQPATYWIGKKTKKHLPDGTENPNWRCFSGPLEVSSIRLAYSMCRSFYKFLVANNTLTANPFEGLRIGAIKKSKSSTGSKRTLSKAARAAIVGALDAIDEKSKAKGARYRWIFWLLLATGLRRSEAVQARLGDLWTSQEGAVWINVVGKGSVEGDVPFPDMLAELFDTYYRLNSGNNVPMARLRELKPETPLIGAYLNADSPITKEALWSTIKELAKAAVDVAEQSGCAHAVIVELQEMSTHWLRHTAAYVQINELGLSLVQVRDNFRHSDISVTSGYIASDHDDRHAKMNSLNAFSAMKGKG